jgi:hypothetical protein
MGFLKRHWSAVLGAISNVPSFWHGLVWLFDWGARIDLAATKLHEYGGLASVLAFLLSPPPWLILITLPAGLLLIWWDVKGRPRFWEGRVLPKGQPKQGPTPRDNSPYWPIRDLFAHIRPDLPLTSLKRTGTTVIDDLDPQWEAVGADVIKQLSLGRLHAIGRKEEYRPIRHLAHALIPPDYWQSAKFYYCFLDPEGTVMDHVVNDDGVRYSELEVNRAEALATWPNGSKEISLFEAATRAYEGTQNKDIAILAEGLTDSPEDILIWYCDRMARHIDGKPPLIKLWGIRPPSRIKEEIYIAALNTRYDFVVRNGVIIFKERYGKSRYEDITVRERELVDAIKYLASLEV